MLVEQLHTLLSKAMEDNPDIQKFIIHVDSERDPTMKLGICRDRQLVLILSEDSYTKVKGMEVYSYEQ